MTALPEVDIYPTVKGGDTPVKYDPVVELDPEGPEIEWRWRCTAANGEIVASGEGYASESNAIRGFKDAARNMNTALHYWRLKGNR